MAQPTRVQGKAMTGGATSGTMTSTPIAGNTLVLYLPGTTAQAGITPTSSNTTWTRADADLPYTQQRYIDVWIGQVNSTPADANIAWGAAANPFVIEFSGMGGYAVNGAQSSGANNAGSATPTTPTVTPASGKEVFILAFSARIGALSSGPTGGFTDDSISSSQKFATKYVASSNGTDTHASVWTYTSSAAWDAFIITLEQSLITATSRPIFTGSKPRFITPRRRIL